MKKNHLLKKFVVASSKNRNRSSVFCPFFSFLLASSLSTLLLLRFHPKMFIQLNLKIVYTVHAYSIQTHSLNIKSYLDRLCLYRRRVRDNKYLQCEIGIDAHCIWYLSILYLTLLYMFIYVRTLIEKKEK